MMRDICEIFASISKEDQEWILDYMCSGKAVIPYETVNSFDSLDICPANNFFEIQDFHSSLKNLVISNEKYQQVKKLSLLLKMRHLGDLNNLYNFQDTLILCKVFESRTKFLNEKFEFNPRKCNSASSFSGCVHRDKSKCVVALTTCS